MKRMIPFLLVLAMLFSGCGGEAEETEAPTAGFGEMMAYPELVDMEAGEIAYQSRFDTETSVVLTDDGITVDGSNETDAVYTSRDIVYYEEKTEYDSGYPYGEGTEADMHSAEEAEAHTVVNITQPGAYRVSGKLSAGQIRVDLGEDAYEDETAVVELILDNADITCTVAPAVLFQNVYECDGDWSTETAQAEVDTSDAGAVLVLEGENTVSGAYVAKIFKDAPDEKKLCKQDGAVYSYMSMNVFGPGSLDLTAANEGLDTELHLTINGGNIAIRSDNDGINTNEDGVSVTTINAGSLHIIAGLGEEGDGVDSNGWLVINGGTVVASANPAADAGLDSDMGSYVNGGTVIALGSTMDWAESDSEQVTMNLQFADFQSSGSAIVVAQEDDTVVFAYDPAADEVLGENVRRYQGAVISTPNLARGGSYNVYVGGSVEGEEIGGVYKATTVTDFADGTLMMYTGTDVGRGFGGVGFGGQMGMMPGEWDENFTLPEGETMPAMPEDFEGGRGQRPEGGWDKNFTMPEGETRPEKPEGFDGHMPQGFSGEMPENFAGQMPGGSEGTGSSRFFMNDKVNAFSGVTAAETE